MGEGRERSKFSELASQTGLVVLYLVMSLYGLVGMIYGERKAWQEFGWAGLINPLTHLYSAWYATTWPYYVFVAEADPEHATRRTNTDISADPCMACVKPSSNQLLLHDVYPGFLGLAECLELRNCPNAVRIRYQASCLAPQHESLLRAEAKCDNDGCEKQAVEAYESTMLRCTAVSTKVDVEVLEIMNAMGQDETYLRSHKFTSTPSNPVDGFATWSQLYDGGAVSVVSAVVVDGRVMKIAFVGEGEIAGLERVWDDMGLNELIGLRRERLTDKDGKTALGGTVVAAGWCQAACNETCSRQQRKCESVHVDSEATGTYVPGTAPSSTMHPTGSCAMTCSQ